MSWWARFTGRHRFEDELDRELRDHFDRLVAEHIRRGRPVDEARRAARLEFGGADQVKESCRDERGTRWAHDLAQDLRFAWRRLRAQPAASLAAVATLACGIGAAAASWSLVASVLVNPLPVADPDRLVVLGERDTGPGATGGLRYSKPYDVYRHVHESGAFPGLAAGGQVSRPVAIGGRTAEPAKVYFASHGFFDLLGISPGRGRDFSAEDDQRGAPLVVILSDHYRRRVFGDNGEVLGQRLMVAGVPATIVGIAPRGFRGLNLTDAPDLYMPLETVGRVTDPRANYFAEDLPTKDSPYSWLTLLARLEGDASAAQAAGRLNALGLARRSFELTDVQTAALPAAARMNVRQFARLLGATVGLLLLSGAFSVGMLLLVRAESRQDEFAMCLALGASRVRLARGVVLEGALLAMAGGLAAIPFTQWLFGAVRTFQLPGDVSIELLNLSVDVHSWMAVAAGGLGSALLMTFVAGAFGLPARRVSLLRSRSGATPRVTRRHARTALVVAQVAIALVLLAGAGLFARSLSAALAVNPGFDAQHLVTGRMALFDSGYSRPAADAFFDELRQRLAVNASVRAFSISASHGGMTPRGQLVVDGQPRRFPSMVYYMAVDDRYFSTIGLEVIQGRDFSRDDRADGPPVAIVSESLGRLLADGADPIGHRIGSPSERNTPRVVGVVPDIITDVTTLEPLVLYHPLIQRPAVAWRAVAIRPAGDPEAAIREVHATIRQMDARVPPPPLRTMEDGLAAQMGPQRFGATILGGLGGIAALLTLLGTYVVAATVAGARRREMGIRAALGARPRQLSGLVFAETARLAGLGIAAGLFLAWLGAGSIRPFLFRTPPLDQVTLGAVAGGMLLLALAVSLRPALSAARVNLVSVLRDE